MRGRTIIVATGARYRKLDVPELERYEGLGVHYAATQAEAHTVFRRPDRHRRRWQLRGAGRDVPLASAGKCHLLIRGESLENSMSRYLIDEIERRDQVDVQMQSRVVALEGGSTLESVVAQDTRTGERRRLPAKAVFVFVGASPRTHWLRGHVGMDDHCFVLIGSDVQGEQLAAHGWGRPLFLETSQRGIFAVGDVRSGSVKRVASAVGEGSMAVTLVHQRLAAA